MNEIFQKQTELVNLMNCFLSTSLYLKATLLVEKKNLHQSVHHCLNQLDQMRMAYDDVVELFFFLLLRSQDPAAVRQPLMR